ncbi:MAG: 2Fe-2S iron-sulfur cluster-binding protein, partial [Candidatus Methanomethyliaceae archaeon]|nr:2Fe-2S iron-sulfur cluster-binding protein [Candidatus Methanomethyliaceae archaeon]
MEYEVKFLPEGKRSTIAAESPLMAAALKGGVDLANICSGKGYCGKCVVEVIEGQLSPHTDWERKRIPPEKLTKGYRLACQALIRGHVVVRVPDQSRVGRQRLVIMGKEPPVALRENVEKIY